MALHSLLLALGPYGPLANNKSAGPFQIRIALQNHVIGILL